MRVYTIVLLLLATLGWAQSQTSSAENQHGPSASPGAEANGRQSAGPDAAVITISGVCQKSAKQKAGSSDCKTVITREQFEQLLQYVQPKLAVPERKNFATAYAQALVAAKKAEEMGLDRGPQFDALMNTQRQFMLEYLFREALQKKASEVPDSDIEQYYRQHVASYQEIEYQRLYIPVAQGFADSKLSSSELQKRRQESTAVMKQVADELHARATRGEEFANLQAEAFKDANYASTGERPTVQTGTLRPRGLPPSEASVMDLKPGDISQVFDESNGHYVYKVLAKRTLPLEEVRGEISEKLRVERLQRFQKSAGESASITLNDSYFLPPTSSGSGD